MNLPNSFTKVIEKYGIDRKDIVFAAMADLDEEFRFADSIVAITDKKLMIARYPYREKKEYRLGGYDSWSIQDDKSAEPAVVFFNLEDVEKLEVLRQVSTGVLMGKIKGAEQYICQFSNTKMEMENGTQFVVHPMEKESPPSWKQRLMPSATIQLH